MQDNQSQAVLTVLQECWTVHKMLRDMLPDIKPDLIQDSELRRLAMQELPQLIHDQEELMEKRIRALGSEPSRQQGSFTGFTDRIRTAMGSDNRMLSNLCSISALLCSMDHALLACSIGNGDHATAVLAKELSNQTHEFEHLMWPLTMQALKGAGHAEQIIPSSQEAAKRQS